MSTIYFSLQSAILALNIGYLLDDPRLFCKLQRLKLIDMDGTKRKLYWQKNLRFLLILLTIWFLVSYGCGILWVEALNAIQIGGFKLGFWFAQQGAIYVFVVLIFVYVYGMNKIDRSFDVDEQ